MQNGITSKYGDEGSMVQRFPSFVVWFTGLSGTGKSSLADELTRRLSQFTRQVIALDGDKLRAGLCSDLGFSTRDRKENMRRVAEVAKLFNENGWIAIAALISPLSEDRSRVKGIVGAEKFVEVYCKCSVETCEKRDVKGLYRLARTGDIARFTGISSPYEPPLSPALVLDTENESLQECADRLFTYILQNRLSRTEFPRTLANA